MPILETKPYLIVRDLNEYLRFDKPGKYRLYVVSTRVIRGPTKEEREKQGMVYMPATSNIIEFTVVPMAAKWAAKQLQSATAILEDTRGYQDVVRHDEEVLLSAARVIRFLDTEDAVRYMVRHLDNDQGNFRYGLMSSPFQATVIKEMEDGLEQPNCAVSDWYLSTLCSCTYARKHLLRSEPYPGTEDKAKLELWQKEQAKIQLARDSIRNGYINKLAGAVLKKESRTKAVCLNTLLSESKNRPNGRLALPAGFVKKLPSELIRVFFDLPASTQKNLLEYRWSWLKSPEIMPVLERYYENPTQEKNTNDTNLAGTALKRILEMEPTRLELMLREIAHPTGRVKFELLTTLPDKTLPQMDAAFAAALEKGPDDSVEQLSLQAQLLSRYGTSTSLPRIKAVLLQKGNSWPCEVLAPVIAYCLRISPPFGTSELRKALSSTSHAERSCKSRMLGMVARLYACPELEALAIRYLEDPDQEMVIDCIETLGKYGTARAEAPLWKRFEKWHDEWKHRAEEMQFFRIGPPLVLPHRMEMGFFSALANAPGWLADAAKLKRIQSLCLSDSIKQTAGDMISDAEAPKKRLSIVPGLGDNWSFQVAQYYNILSLEALKAKLLQFPKGTGFSWCPYNPGQEEEKKSAVFEEMKKFLAEHGMRLEEFHPPK